MTQKSKPQPLEFICSKCGSSDVEEKAWVKINTGEVIGAEDDSPVWCCQCEQETYIEEKK